MSNPSQRANMIPSQSSTSSGRYLPEEVLVHIGSQLDKKLDRNTIATLRLANKHLYRIATAHMHCTVTVYLAGQNGQPCEPPSSQWIVQRLMTYPRTADMIKELQVDLVFNFPPHRQGREPPLSHVTPFKDSSLPADLEHHIGNAIKDGDEEGCVAYFLALCKNLEIIQLESGGYAHSRLSRLISRVFEHAVSSSRPGGIGNKPFRPLQRVRSITLDDITILDDVTYGVSLAAALEMICLPQLHYLKISQLTDENDDDAPTYDHKLPEGKGPVANSNPLTLVFDRTTISGEGLAFLLASCPNTKSLKMRWQLDLVDMNKKLRKESIGDAVRAHGSRLQYLHLDTTEANDYHADPTSLGSFASLRLHTLIVPVTALILGGAAALPKVTAESVIELSESTETLAAASNAIAESIVELPESLKTLYILGVQPGRDGEAFLSLRGYANFPKLQKVVCVPWYHFEDEERTGVYNMKCIDYNRFPDLGLRNTDTEE